VSRVASEAALIQSRLHSPHSRAPANDARRPESPFGSLLDMDAAPPPRERPDAPAAPSRKGEARSSGEARPNQNNQNNQTNQSGQAAPRSDRPDENAAPEQPATTSEAAPAQDGQIDDQQAAEADKAAQAETLDAAVSALTETPAQPPVAAATPDAVPVTPPPVDPALTMASVEDSSASAQTAEITAAAAATTNAAPNANLETNAAALATDATTDQKGKPSGSQTVHAGPKVPGEAKPAAPEAETHDGKPAEAPSESGDKPAPVHVHGPLSPDAPTHEHGKARVRADDLQIAAAIDTAKPATDNAPQPANLQANHLNTASGPTHAGAAQTATGTADAAVPVAGLAVEIAARAQPGRNRFEIRLDPPELGRIDVRLDVDSGGNVTSRLTVDKAETLDLLRRDAPELERALQQAGLKTGDGGMQFSLRDQSFAGRDDGRQAQSMARVVVPDADLPAIDTTQSYGRTLSRSGGVDIHV
jgi:flagellar hook-length control protein FliK